MKKNKNLKGFTLVEEVVSLAILSILILVASGMMIAAMRVYSVNVKTQSAQNKGQYVYDLLDEKLTYASGIQYQTISENNGTTETSPFSPPNDTYFKGGSVKKIFEDNEVCQNISVDKSGITNSFNNQKIDFGQYDVDVSLELETQTEAETASASADNSMNDEALFDLVSNSEVTDSAGSLTPQGEVSFLGGLEMMNQRAEVMTVATAGVDCTFYTKDSVNQVWGRPYVDISKLKGKVARIKLFNLSLNDSIELFSGNGGVYKGKSNIYTKNDVEVEKEYVDKINNSDVNYLALYCNPEYVSFYDANGNLLDANGNVVTGKTQTLKIDNSEADREITLWAGESVNYSVSSTLENFNNLTFGGDNRNGKLYIELKKENDIITGFSIKALKPDTDTDVQLTVTDGYYLKNPIDGDVIDEKGVPIRITVHIKVPQINTADVVVYQGETQIINTGNIPIDYLTCQSGTATSLSVSKQNGKIVVSAGNTETTIPITITYTCDNITYTFNINVTITRRPETTISTTSEPTTTTTTTVTTAAATSNSGKAMSSYRLKLIVTVNDKKGREIYKRSGSISVMNYENSNMTALMKTKRFPSSMNLNNTTNDGFVLKIYYID